MREIWRTENLLDLSHTKAKPWFEKIKYPFEILDSIENIILAIGDTLPLAEYEKAAPDIWIAKDAEISDTATLFGPLILDHETEVRPSAYLRGKVLAGCGCVIGNSTELKNAILFDEAKAPHFNYVGDSVLGFRAHMGAGSITSNVRLDKREIKVILPDTVVQTGRKKCGAILGDGAEIGCHAVVNPGSVIGRHAAVYPLCAVYGYVTENAVVKPK